MLMNRYEEEKIDHLFGYLEPFKPNKKKKVKYTGHIISFDNALHGTLCVRCENMQASVCK